MTDTQTPGSAVDPQTAGPGPRVPASARGAAAEAGDPANVDQAVLALGRLIGRLAEQLGDAQAERRLAETERDNARAMAARWGTGAMRLSARVRAAVHCADPVENDVTDWQRGYRACAERALAALDPPGGGT